MKIVRNQRDDDRQYFQWFLRVIKCCVEVRRTLQRLDVATDVLSY